jgi:uncharacterized protein YqgC (DUF456 family)
MYHESRHRYDDCIMESGVLLWVLGTVLVLAGLAGTLLPLLPGIPLMMAGMLLVAWADGFTRIGGATLLVLAALTVLSLLAEALAAALGAKRVGASRAAVAGAALGALFGFFAGIIGILVGPFVGAMAGELLARPGATRAVEVGVGAWAGFLIGTVAKVAIAFVMLALFIAALFID